MATLVHSPSLARRRLEAFPGVEITTRASLS
jgi:hypothetical protein